MGATGEASIQRGWRVQGAITSIEGIPLMVTRWRGKKLSEEECHGSQLYPKLQKHHKNIRVLPRHYSICKERNAMDERNPNEKERSASRSLRPWTNSPENLEKREEDQRTRSIDGG